MKLEKIGRFRCRYDEISEIIKRYQKLGYYLQYFLDDVWNKDLNDYIIECVVDIYSPIKRETITNY